MMHLNYTSLLKFTVLLISVMISACPAPTKTNVNVNGSAKLMKPSSGGIVLFPTYADAATGNEVDFIRCLKKKLKKQASKRVRMVDTGFFQDNTFPWFEPHYAPTTIEEMNALLSQRMVRERIASLGVRYLVSIAFSSDDDVEIPGIICGGGYGAVGCLGIYFDQKRSKVYAVIFDIVKGDQAVSLSVTTSGKSYGFALIVPVLFLANTESEACKVVSDRFGQLIFDATDAK